MSPRRVQSTGRPNTPVIPAGWETAHRVVMAGTMRGRVALREPGTVQDWSTELDQMVAIPKTPYDAAVPARIQQLNGEARITVTADDEEIVLDYLVAVPATVGVVAEGHLVDVTASGDPLLDGRTLRVVQIVTGTERFERDLLCTLT